jgi:hypothetical protein
MKTTIILLLAVIAVAGIVVAYTVSSDSSARHAAIVKRCTEREIKELPMTGPERDAAERGQLPARLGGWLQSCVAASQ